VLERAGLNSASLAKLPAYNDLLRFLNGNPLAIQVILPELARGIKPDDLLASLRTGEAKLADVDREQGRQKSLAASLEYRLDALDPLVRQRLGLLALFQGFVDADWIALLCEQEGAPPLIARLTRDDWLPILDAAAEIGLLRSLGDGYYTIHPALPWFFEGLLHETLPDAGEWLQRAFADVYGSVGGNLFELMNTSAKLAIALLRYEEENLHQALRLARRHEQWRAAQGILYGLRMLLATLGRWTEWERLVTEIEADMTDDGEPHPGREDLCIALLGHRQEIAAFRHDFDAQQQINDQLRTHFERVGDERNLAGSLHQLGMVAQARRQFEEAERWYRQALTSWSGSGMNAARPSSSITSG
jgi:hypothetical protein